MPTPTSPQARDDEQDKPSEQRTVVELVAAAVARVSDPGDTGVRVKGKQY